MSTAIHILERLEALGVSISIDGSELVMRPGSKVPVEIGDDVRQHKTEVLDYIRREAPASESEPWMLREWRRVSIPDWQRILLESIAEGDRRREGYARWMLREVLVDPEYR